MGKLGNLPSERVVKSLRRPHALASRRYSIGWLAVSLSRWLRANEESQFQTRVSLHGHCIETKGEGGKGKLTDIYSEKERRGYSKWSFEHTPKLTLLTRKVVIGIIGRGTQPQQPNVKDHA
jgi:hypothetical protein